MVPVSWQGLALNRIIRMRSGEFVSNDDIETEGTYPVYGGNGFRGFTGRFNTVGPIVLVGRQGALCGNVHVAHGQLWVSEHALRCFPEKQLDAKWLAYALQHMNLNQYSVSAAQPGISVDNLKRLRMLVPPLETQQRIARFLDDKTARIDALIDKKRALLDRLAEKRQALITRAVTKGLNPDAPMKPSGIEWLGDIPAHWEIRRFRFTAKLISGSTPTTTVHEYWNGEIPWISPKDVKADELLSSADRVTEYAISDYGLKVHEDDHAVIVIRGMILARKVPVAVARGKYTINQDMKVIRSKGDVRPEFFQMYLSSIESYLFTLVAEAGHGTKALRTDVLSDVPVLVPTLSDQDQIIDVITRNRAEADATVEKIKASIDGLTEYRSALITAAVTGQIDGLN